MKGLLPCSSALRAWADLSEDIIGIQAGVVAIAPKELDGVATYDLILHGVNIHGDCPWIKFALVGPLANACRTVALKSKVPMGVGACVTVAPLNTDVVMLNIDGGRGSYALVCHMKTSSHKD